MQIALEVGKPWGTNFPNHIHFKHLFSTITYKGMWPNWSCKTLALSLHLYTILGVVNTFSMLLKSIFYQVIYIDTIFLKSMWFIFGIPKQWHHYLISS